MDENKIRKHIEIDMSDSEFSTDSTVHHNASESVEEELLQSPRKGGDTRSSDPTSSKGGKVDVSNSNKHGTQETNPRPSTAGPSGSTSNEPRKLVDQTQKPYPQ